jgi:TRAP-type C4-dicarboxylate transport system permease large subunit
MDGVETPTEAAAISSVRHFFLELMQ